MIRINLLPHRQQAREQRKREFLGLLALTLISCAAIWYLGHAYLNGRIETQEARNKLLKDETLKLDKQLAEIKRLKDDIAALIARKQVVETLQSNRTESVRVLDQFVRQMPEGVFLKSVKQTGTNINMVGLSPSNSRVSNLMRNVEGSTTLTTPELVETKAITVQPNNARTTEFSMNVKVRGTEPLAPAKAPEISAASQAVPSKADQLRQDLTAKALK